MNLINQTILNYTVEKEIGEGGMGIVYLASDTLGGKVAIKSLKPIFHTNKEARQRFRQEAKNLQELNHENIVRIINYNENESGLFLVLEYIEGLQLDDYLANHRGLIPYDEAVKITTQVLNGLNHAHSKGMIHRDIKPSNIILQKDGKVKLIDFGIAKMLDSDQNLAHTIVQGNIGSPRYMSPEQHKGLMVDLRTDIYSAGIVLYELLTGKNPYLDINNYYEVSKEIIERELPPPSSIYPFIPSNVDYAILMAIQKNPSERFKTCANFIDALNDYTKEEECLVTFSSDIDSFFIFNSQGKYGKEADFTFHPGVKNELIVGAEKRETYKEILILTPSDIGGKRKISLTHLQKEKAGPLNNTIFTYLLSTASIILAIALILFFQSLNQIKSENQDLKKELNYYKLLQQ